MQDYFSFSHPITSPPDFVSCNPAVIGEPFVAHHLRRRDHIIDPSAGSMVMRI